MFNFTMDPVLVDFGPVEIRYYGVVYVIGFILGYFFLRRLVAEKHLHISKEDTLDYIISVAVGGVVGARIFYCLVYNFNYYLLRPWEVFYVWNGGMSFHGGLIGAAVAVIIFCRMRKLNPLQMADLSVIPLAIALSLGRIANFINGELVGRMTDVSWCFNFPNTEGCRHPSQLYEALKNFIIFLTLWFIRDKKFKPGTLFGIFLVMYGSARLIIEFFREADPQIGYLMFGFTLGQDLSILMFIIGCAWLFFLYYFVHDKSLKSK